MVTKVDKRDRADLFRNRLTQALADKAMSQAALARAVGADRSTVSQLLTGDGARMPNAQLVAEVALALGVSSDWLLGLSDRPEPAADQVAKAVVMTGAERALLDDTIFGWHREAAGYKIRHVPAALPDMLKTDAVLAWEYASSLGASPDQAIRASRERLDWMQGARSDYEIAFPMHEIECFAAAEGYYRGLPAALRREQIAHLAALHGQLYPTLRVHLYDARRLFSAPVTIFGPLNAVIYMGRNYVSFRDPARIEVLTAHFDVLVREAEVPSRQFPNELGRLSALVG